jgi:hypothetical protein
MELKVRLTVALLATIPATQLTAAALHPRPAIQNPCGDPDALPSDPGVALAMPLDTIEDQPDPFLGRAVTVTGEVEEVFGPRVFTIDEPGWVDWEDEVVVVVPSDLPTAFRPEDRLTVTGTLLSAVSAVLDQTSARLTANHPGDLAGRSVILAQRITICSAAPPDAVLRDDRSRAKETSRWISPHTAQPSVRR